jgi:hypothetical protein
VLLARFCGANEEQADPKKINRVGCVCVEYDCMSMRMNLVSTSAPDATLTLAMPKQGNEQVNLSCSLHQGDRREGTFRPPQFGEHQATLQ